MPEPAKKPASAFIKKPKTADVVEGGVAVFEAETEKTGVKVKWQRNGVEIIADEKYVIMSEGNKHSLTINNVRKEDDVTYAVIAGSSKVKFELKVKEPEKLEEVPPPEVTSEPTVTNISTTADTGPTDGNKGSEVRAANSILVPLDQSGKIKPFAATFKQCRCAQRSLFSETCPWKFSLSSPLTPQAEGFFRLLGDASVDNWDMLCPHLLYNITSLVFICSALSVTDILKAHWLNREQRHPPHSLVLHIYIDLWGFEASLSLKIFWFVSSVFLVSQTE
ncbi:Myosin-binding protein C, cardiac-type, partial [Varanus komodoensis]